MKGVSEAEFELAFHDKLGQFIEGAADSTAGLEAHLAQCLGEFLPRIDLFVLWWEENGSGEQPGARGGAEILGQSGGSVLVSSAALEPGRVDEILASPPFAALGSDFGRSPTQIASVEAEWLDKGIAVSSRHARQINHLVIAVRGTGSAAWPRVEDRWRWLTVNIRALHLLESYFSGLRNLERQYRVMAETGEMMSRLGRSTRDRLKIARKIARQLAALRFIEPRRQMTLDLAEAVMQEALGTGWDRHPPTGESFEEAYGVVDDLVRLRDSLSAQGTDAADLENRGLHRRLDALIRTIQFAAGIPPGKRRGGSAAPNAKLDLDLQIETWTRIYVEARKKREKVRGYAAEGESRKWRRSVGKEIPKLGAILQGRIREKIATLYLPPWLRLWFCHELLGHALGDESFQKRNVVAAQIWEFRRDLAYVIRESLRMLGYGDRPDYMFQTAAYTAALRTLVEQHAVWIVGLPRQLDIRGLLAEIGRARTVQSAEIAVGHLQHVLEIYVAGHFLSSIELTGSAPEETGTTTEETEAAPEETGTTVARHLASGSWKSAGPALERQFKSAFSLVALLHDVGLLLLPEASPGPAEEILGIDPAMGRRLAALVEDFRQPTSVFLEECLRELIDAKHIDPGREKRLIELFERRIAAGEPDHCLLGAWYVHRLCRKTPGLAQHHHSHRQIVRAVLLHRAVTQPVRMIEDPVAALLVLCDELFDWSPASQRRLTPDQVGRAFYSLAADVRPQASRFHYIEVEGLKVGRANEKDPASRMRAVLPVADFEADWPVFELTLQNPEYLDRPVYHYWLATSQNLERLAGEPGHWSPRITLRSELSEMQEALDLDTHKLLIEVAELCGPVLRPELYEWLGGRDEEGEEAKRFERGEGFESFGLRCRGLSLFNGDIRRQLARIDEIVDDLPAVRGR